VLELKLKWEEVARRKGRKVGNQRKNSAGAPKVKRSSRVLTHYLPQATQNGVQRVSKKLLI
jgi:hypothetical protein